MAGSGSSQKIPNETVLDLVFGDQSDFQEETPTDTRCRWRGALHWQVRKVTRVHCTGKRQGCTVEARAREAHYNGR